MAIKSWNDLAWKQIPTPFGPHIFPPKELVYKAFDLTPFDKVKVVILGQDPYPTKGYANGLAFSVRPDVKPLPRSLQNIFKEYRDDLGYPQPRNGDLTLWAERGVLLLNSVLTVEEGKPLSHRGLGWEKLTIEVVQKLSEYREGLVFLLWGKSAQEYGGLINASKHLVYRSSHPSPLSADRGFLGSRPFSTANEFLTEPIDWRL